MQLRKVAAGVGRGFRASRRASRRSPDRRRRTAVNAARATGQQLQQFVLAGVGVLVFVDQQIAQAVLPFLADLFVLGEQLRRAQDQIVEIERLIGVQRRGVAAIDDCRLVLVLVRRQHRRLIRRDHPVLPQRDDRLDLADQALVGGAELFLHHAEAVVGVHDRELWLQADVRRFLTHDLHAERVEGADRQLVDGHLAAFLAGRRERPAFEQLRRAFAHFERGLVREGERGDVLRLEAPAFDQVRDFLRDHARLAAAGAGEHETGTIEIAHRFVLRGVETCGHRVWTLRGVGRKDRATAGWTAKLGVIEEPQFREARC